MNCQNKLWIQDKNFLECYFKAKYRIKYSFVFLPEQVSKSVHIFKTIREKTVLKNFNSFNINNMHTIYMFKKNLQT